MTVLSQLVDCLTHEIAVLRDVQSVPGTCRALIWSSQPGLAVTRRDARLPNFEKAQKTMLKRRIPVVVRDSGGSAIVQGPGIINLTLVSSQRHRLEGSFKAEYLHLGQILMEAVNTLGVGAELGSVPNAYCDGEYNLVAHGRKIAGTAQRRVRGAVLSHACINLSADDSDMAAIINAFYELAGGTLVCDSGAGTSIENLTLAKRSIRPFSMTDRPSFLGILEKTLYNHGYRGIIASPDPQRENIPDAAPSTTRSSRELPIAKSSLPIKSKNCEPDPGLSLLTRVFIPTITG